MILFGEVSEIRLVLVQQQLRLNTIATLAWRVPRPPSPSRSELLAVGTLILVVKHTSKCVSAFQLGWGDIYFILRGATPRNSNVGKYSTEIRWKRPS
jgi:hypothetical protein